MNKTTKIFKHNLNNNNLRIIELKISTDQGDNRKYLPSFTKE
jgi:hypothetical protein